ncbi:signal recognition particle protein, partial [Bacillus cereus]|nr:signal recognition particle protein [Bacillus cereus]
NNTSRKKRIAKGIGKKEQEIKRLKNQFHENKKIKKKITGIQKFNKK